MTTLAAEKKAFQTGYLIAVSNILNLHGDEVVAGDVLRELGVTASALRGMELTEYDAKPLRRLFRTLKRRNAA